MTPTEEQGDPAAHPTAHLLGLNSAQFVAAMRGKIIFDAVGGERGAMKAFREIFRSGRTDIPGAEFRPPRVVQTQQSESPEGTVIKFVSRLDGELPGGVAAEVESVLIPMVGSAGRQKYTLCLSSQVGCAMGCTFCETAQMGLMRSLTAAEIVGQWWAARHIVGYSVGNAVFMGMGEPMDNFDNVFQAVSVLKDHNGPNIGVSKITISTVGRVDGILKMAERIREPGWHRLQLALSLNASNDEVRSSIMPVNRKWSIADLRDALKKWPRFAGNKLCVEYVLIPGVNDRPEHMDEIAAFMTSLKNGDKHMGILNLIPYNPRRNSPWPAPDEAHVAAFLGGLIDRGVFAKRRRTKGRDMMGACGQLGAAHIRQRRFVQPTISA
ncbi:MAG: 23S rRNA (adenine(2503)-C(2))-methyltransferase RlmN [Phycisphaerales bacterium]